MTSISRRTFFAASSFTLLAATPRTSVANAMVPRIDGGLPESFPTQDPEVVRAVVGKAHVDYDGVRQLVAPRPELAKATWDWGFGDWESALGAAPTWAGATSLTC